MSNQDEQQQPQPQGHVVTCGSCGGKGRHPMSTHDCRVCGGVGKVVLH
ncbi:hypothetical protein [Microbispora triticiradicis]|nr:hypothetical protein [Microbispora triticiradicis]MBO4271326.1 hypothetical protein [Microbispora triticiradicis]